MRKALSVLSILIVISMLFACGGGGGGGGSGSGGGNGAKKTVAIRFDLSLSNEVKKSIDYSPDPNYYNDIEFWYRAIPQKVSNDGSAVGDTRNVAGKDKAYFVKLTFMDHNNKIPASMRNSSGTVGYFTEGQWAFDIEVRKPVNKSSYVVLWKTFSPIVKTINAKNNNITFLLSKNIDSSKKGIVNFDITVLKTSDTDYFKVYYSDIDPNKPGEIPITAGLIKGVSQDGTKATLTGRTELSSGLYLIKVQYYSNTDVWVGGDITEVEVLPSGEVTVSGSIRSDHVHETFFTLKGMYKLSVSVSATPVNKINNENDIYSVSKASTGTVHFTCTPTITEFDGSPVANEPTYYYEWRINGAKVNANNDEASYDWVLAPEDTKQNAYVDCIVYFKDNETVIGSACATFRLVITE